MPRPRLFCDANVLYPYFLRDLLIRLGIAGIVELRWSDAVHDEWTRNLLERHPALRPTDLERTRRLMERALPQASVPVPVELVARLNLPDPDDRHVLAAAITGQVSQLLTFNLRDFPAPAMQPWAIEVIHPDAWLLGVLDRHAEDVLTLLTQMAQPLRTPPMTAADVAGAFQKAGLPDVGQRLTELLEARETPG